MRRTRRGERFLVLYRSRPAFQVVPVADDSAAAHVPLEEDSLFRAEAVGHFTDRLTAKDDDRALYGVRR